MDAVGGVDRGDSPLQVGFQMVGVEGTGEREAYKQKGSIFYGLTESLNSIALFSRRSAQWFSEKLVAQFMRGKHLPDNLHAILSKDGIRRHHRVSGTEGLSDEHAVKRIAVRAGEVPGSQTLFNGYRQLKKPRLS